MTTRIFNILPFLVITVVCVAGVEGFYLALERFVLTNPVTEIEIPVDQKVVKSGDVKDENLRKTVNYSIITKRNLFGKPPVAGEIQQPQPEVEEELEVTKLEVVLMGTIGSGENSRAIILNKKDRKQELYSIGDEVQGADIKEIRRGKVILSHNGKDEMLDMSEAAQFGPRSQRPTSVSPTTRRATIGAQTGSSQSVTTQQRITKPRVVRPTRRIVRPRSTTASTVVRSIGEEVPPESLEDLELPDDTEEVEQDQEAEEEELEAEQDEEEQEQLEEQEQQ